MYCILSFTYFISDGDLISQDWSYFYLYY